MAESRIQDTNGYHVYGWMITRLGLKGIALHVFAIIWSFSQDGASVFYGSVQYLMDFTCTASKHTIIKATKELTERGYIYQVPNPTKESQTNAYKVNLQAILELCQGGAENAPGGCKKCTPTSAKNAPPGGAKIAPKIEDIKREDSKEKNKWASPFGADYSGTNFSDGMKAQFDEWLRYKSERKEKYTPTGLGKLVSKVQNYVNKCGEDAVMAQIQNAMSENWVGMNLDKMKPQTPKKNIAPSPNVGGRSEAKTTAMQSDVDDFDKFVASLGVTK